MTSCPEAELLPGFLAGNLSDTEFAEVHKHLEGCDPCVPCVTELERLNAEATNDTERVEVQAAAKLRESELAFLTRIRKVPPIDELAEPLHVPFGPSTPKGPLGQLKSFHVIEKLGAGSFGAVFRAYCERLDRMVAVKVLNPEQAISREMRERFSREARRAAEIDHENVIRIYDVDHAPDGTPFLVMEFIDGETLGAALKRLGCLRPGEAARIVREVALGLAAADKSNLIHRDIKPANIMLSREGGRVKIADFGLARKIVTADTRLTASGAYLGTPLYMSPEQITSGEKIDPRSDLYSLGVVLYELLTGQVPFRGETHFDIFKKTVENKPIPPRNINGAIPADLETITLKCLEKDPCQRYWGAQALADDLQRFLLNGPISARREELSATILENTPKNVEQKTGIPNSAQRSHEGPQEPVTEGKTAGRLTGIFLVLISLFLFWPAVIWWEHEAFKDYLYLSMFSRADGPLLFVRGCYLGVTGLILCVCFPILRTKFSFLGNSHGYVGLAGLAYVILIAGTIPHDVGINPVEIRPIQIQVHAGLLTAAIIVILLATSLPVLVPRLLSLGLFVWMIYVLINAWSLARTAAIPYANTMLSGTSPRSVTIVNLSWAFLLIGAFLLLNAALFSPPGKKRSDAKAAVVVCPQCGTVRGLKASFCDRCKIWLK